MKENGDGGGEAMVMMMIKGIGEKGCCRLLMFPKIELGAMNDGDDGSLVPCGAIGLEESDGSGAFLIRAIFLDE
jgi:hypothetical protein